MAYTEEELKKELETQEYEYGFVTKIDADTFSEGLNESVIRAISKRKEEPNWMTEWRLKAFDSWKKMEEPNWSQFTKHGFPFFMCSGSLKRQQYIIRMSGPPRHK